MAKSKAYSTYPADSIIYQQQDGIYLKYSRSSKQIVLCNDTDNDLVLSCDLRVIYNADYNTYASTKDVHIKNAVISANSISYFTNENDPFSRDPISTKNDDFDIDDVDLTTWVFDTLRIYQYDGNWDDDPKPLTFETAKIVVDGQCFYNADISNNYLNVTLGYKSLMDFDFTLNTINAFVTRNA